MPSNIDKFKEDFGKLLERGRNLQIDLFNKIRPTKAVPLKGKSVDFLRNYQSWYSEASLVIEQLLPQRLAEFVALYEGPANRKKIDTVSYSISDYCVGIGSQTNQYGEKILDSGMAFMKFQSQVQILESVSQRFESSLFNIKQLAQADLFDSELDAAAELLKHKFVRPAGVVSGVVLEKHLAEVCTSHRTTVKKTDATINDLNDVLKNAGVIDIPLWRSIQHLADLRNLCAHNKGREPTKDDVLELMEGVRRSQRRFSRFHSHFAST